MWVLAILLCSVTIALVFTVQRLNSMTEEAIEATEHQHARCMALVTAFVGDQFAARVLEAAAADYETVEGQQRLSALRWSDWVEGGPCVPALWLKDRANALRGYAIDPDEEPDDD